jgi:predicted transcriptional regulator of viral defense system
MHDSLLKDILSSNQTVFSIKELLLLWGKADPALLRARISYYLAKGYLYHLRRGLYAKNKDYNRFEVATKIFTPAYVSFETVLLKSGVIFQWYDRVFVASYQTRTISCDGQTYEYRRLKGAILTDTRGVAIEEHFSIATAERAFLDMSYLHKGYWFDNLSALEWDKVFELLPLYSNKRLEVRVHKLYKSFKEQQ